MILVQLVGVGRSWKWAKTPILHPDWARPGQDFRRHPTRMRGSAECFHVATPCRVGKYKNPDAASISWIGAATAPG